MNELNVSNIFAIKFLNVIFLLTAVMIKYKKKIKSSN